MEMLSQVNPASWLSPADQAQGTTVSSTGFDWSGYSDAVMTLRVGAIPASLGPTFRIQESDDNSAWTNISSDTAKIVLADTDDNQSKNVRVKLGAARKKFGRIQCVVPSGTGSVERSAVLLVSGPHQHVAAPAVTPDVSIVV